VRRRKAKRGGA